MDLSRFRCGTGAARAGVVLLACLLLAACTKVTMYGDLEERQANEVFAALLSANIDAEKQTSLSKTGWEIRVDRADFAHARSEEHTSELQSRENLVCRLLLEKKKTYNK